MERMKSSSMFESFYYISCEIQMLLISSEFVYRQCHVPAGAERRCVRYGIAIFPPKLHTLPLKPHRNTNLQHIELLKRLVGFCYKDKGKCNLTIEPKRQDNLSFKCICLYANTLVPFSTTYKRIRQ